MDANSLYAENTALVPYVLNKLGLANKDAFIEQEFLAAGYEGLSEAALSYKPEKGIKFATFAYKVIKNAMYMHLRDYKRHRSKKSLNEKALYWLEDDELSLQDELEFPEQAIRDVHQDDQDNVDDILAALVTYAKVDEQEFFIKHAILGIPQTAIAKEAGYSGNSMVSRKILNVKKNILPIMSYMENKKDAPNKKDFKTKKAWRKAYAEFYIQHKEKAKSNNRDLVESELIEKIFS